MTTQTTHRTESKTKALLRLFHNLQRLRVVLTEEIERTREKILFTESFLTEDEK